jgi:hypothetical protein
MLKMKWKTCGEGRLVATWIPTADLALKGCHEATIMLNMKWRMNPDGRLVAIPDPSGEAPSPKAHAAAKVSRYISKKPILILFWLLITFPGTLMLISHQDRPPL